MEMGATPTDEDREPTIAPLVHDEERWLETVHRTDGNRNDIFLIHRRSMDEDTSGEPTNFVTIIRATDSDPNETPRAWHRGSDERSVYLQVAEALSTPRQCWAPERRSTPTFSGSSIASARRGPAEGKYSQTRRRVMSQLAPKYSGPRGLASSRPTRRSGSARRSRSTETTVYRERRS